MESIAVSRKEARRYLLRYQHLTDDTGLPALEDIPAYVKKVGCIQFDPLDPVGRNPDLVLQARCPAYRKYDMDKLLYEDRVLIDAWDKNMAICSVGDWPYFSRTKALPHSHYQGIGHGIEPTLQWLREHEYASSSDIGLEEKVRWYWEVQRLSRAALEYLNYTGRVVVHHKAGTRRFFALTENVLPSRLVEMEDPNDTDEKYWRWMSLRRINSLGFLWNRGSDAWLGSRMKGEQRNRGFSALLEEERILPVHVEGLKYPVYMDRENLPLLERAAGREIPDSNVRILGPLDNLLWDRRLVERLFGFDYRWEVYTPAAKRKYGYYVLPVLQGDRFTGRVELATDKVGGALAVKSFWWEGDIGAGAKRGLAKHIRAALKRFAAYNRCKHIRYEAAL